MLYPIFGEYHRQVHVGGYGGRKWLGVSELEALEAAIYQSRKMCFDHI
jgi:hypothetical protein